MTDRRRPARGRRARIAALAALVAFAFAGAAMAQDAEPADDEFIPFPLPNPLHVVAPAPPADAEGPGLLIPPEALGNAPDALGFLPAADTPLDLAPLLQGPDSDALPQPVTLSAVLVPGGPAIPHGVRWGIFSGTAGADGRYPLVAEAQGGVASINIQTGGYYIYTAYGHAQVVGMLRVPPGGSDHVVVLNAGGLRLHATVGDDTRLRAGEVRFDIFVDDPARLEGTPIVENASPGDIVRLNAGFYHVVSSYGDGNAVVRADIEVEAGLLTDLSLEHEAAQVTLKLVTERGGEALANTSWQVVSPGGESVFESVGAFPSIVLAAGDYTAIAIHDGSVFEVPFSIVPGVNRDVEVVVGDARPVEAAAGGG
ncbi:MAG: hypothetical protein KIS96_09245 [Bauldia sp.]|nr:hypothetical protein [Bauldia sp.]